MDYVMPFFIIICIGIIIVLLFKLWSAFTNPYVPRAAYMHIVEGNAQMKTWGTDNFFSLSSDALIMQGDELMMSADGLAVIEFLDGTLMRLDSGTDVSFLEVDEDEGIINLLLVDGTIWINKVYKASGKGTKIVVKTTNLEVVSSQDSIFEVENGFEEVVRVFSGKGDDLELNIFDEVGEKIVETENIGVGQEIVFSDMVLKNYWEFKSPTVLAAISDDFKDTDFYKWNSMEDKNPSVFERAEFGTGFVRVEPEEIAEEDQIFEPELKPVGEDVEEGIVEEPVAEDPVVEEPVAEEPVAEEPVATNMSVPKVVSVSGGMETDADGYFVVTHSPAVIKGEISGAAKVVVNTYTLQKFKSGESSWTYFANADYDLMKVGENTYEVYAIDSNGNRGESIFVKVKYQPAVVEEEVAEEEPAEEPSTEPIVENSL